jgi:hypothetical protein
MPRADTLREYRWPRNVYVFGNLKYAASEFTEAKIPILSNLPLQELKLNSITLKN